MYCGYISTSMIFTMEGTQGRRGEAVVEVNEDKSNAQQVQ